MPEIWFNNLGIKINHLKSVAFTVFGIDVYWYGVIMALSILCGYFVAVYEAKRTKQDINIYSDYLLYAIIFSVIGARTYYVIFRWDYYKDNLAQIFALRHGGIAIYGAIIGAVITAVIYTRIKKVSFFKFMDTAVFGLVTGQIIGRWGNFVNREAFGGYTDNLFSMRILKEQAKYIPDSVLDKIVNINGYEYIQVHPTFLYESLWNIGVLILLTLYKKRKKFDGEIMFLYMIFYGLGRFWIESLRTDQLIFFNTGIPVSMIVSLLIVILGLSLIIIKRYRLKNNL